MKTQFLPVGLLCAISLALSPPVSACQACGSKAGVPFERIHPGHNAGQIILFVRPDSDLRSFNKKADLSFQLQRLGHTVHLIDNDRNLDAAIRANRTDVVLAEPADATALRSRLAGNSAAPVVLSLTTASTAASDADPKVSSCLVQAAANQSRDVVQTIELIIYSRQAGEIINCPSSGG
ncbi:MAG: hypothetical protein ABJC66_10775 [Gammaproteobacteria bacterium]